MKHNLINHAITKAMYVYVICWKNVDYLMAINIITYLIHMVQKWSSIFPSPNFLF